MSIGFEVHHPADLQGKGCYFLAGDPIGPKLFATIGGINAKEVTVPEILPNLTNGSIQVLTVPPLAAEQLQWASRVTHINTMTTGFGIGAIIVSTPKVAGLPDNLKTALNARGAETAERLTKSHPQPRRAVFRAPQERARRPTSRATPRSRSGSDLFAKVRGGSCAGSVFTPGMFDKVVGLAQ